MASLIPFKTDKGLNCLTAHSGLLTYVELMAKQKLLQIADRLLGIRKAGLGYSDGQMILSLILMQIAGGDCVEDINQLRSDRALCLILDKLREKCTAGDSAPNRKILSGIPSPSSVWRWLSWFNDGKADAPRVKSGAFIPAMNRYLSQLSQLNKRVIKPLFKHILQAVATLDMDATLLKTENKFARFCYKGYKAFQPLNVWLSELGIMLHTEMRDGNVPAGFDQARILTEAIELLPSSVREIRMRSDSAGYQWDLMKLCQNHQKPISFAISCSVCSTFKQAVAEVEKDDWKPIYRVEKSGALSGKIVKSGQEWAEVAYVPSALCQQSKDHVYRYIAIREKMWQELPFAKDPDTKFPTCHLNFARYKLFGIVTNIPYGEEIESNRGTAGDFDKTGMYGEPIIHWHRERCGYSEQAHSVLKSDFAGGTMSSKKFGVNAAWWWITIIAMNLVTVMKTLFLEPQYRDKRMKAMRLQLINIPGKIVTHARQIYLKVGECYNHAVRVWEDAIRKMTRLLPEDKPG